jgi:tetratricopeptide (TPR) repeat protein
MILTSERQRNILICLGLALAIAVVYSPVVRFGFINYDDPTYVTDNAFVKAGLTFKGFVWAFTNTSAYNWHPLTWLSHMLDCQLFGLNAGAHHLVNVIFHVANTLLLFSVLRRMTRAPWRSAFVAAVFALHPLHVESVAWVAERKDVLSALFWVLTIWAYVRYVENLKPQNSKLKASPQTRSPLPPLSAFRSPPSLFYFLALLFFSLGLMAKPMVVTLPFVLLLLDYWPLGRTPWVKPLVGDEARTPLGELLQEKLPFLALTALSCVVTFRAQSVGGAVESLERLPVGDRLSNAVVSYVRYLGKLLWPSRLTAFYPYEKWPFEIVMGTGVILLGVSVWVILRARREPQLFVGWFWFVGTLMPVIGLLQVGAQSMADRYTYLPSIGFLIMLAWSVPSGTIGQRLPKPVVASVGVALAGLCAIPCWFQVGYWKGSETLFRHALEVTRGNWMAHNNLALALWQARKPQEAVEHFEAALRLRPDSAEAHNNLGNALRQIGKLQEAIGCFDKALQIKPDYAEAHYNVGLALFALGQKQEAVRHLEKAVRLKPDFAEAYRNLGTVLLLTGNAKDAIQSYRQALRLRPDDAETHSGMGTALNQLGRTQDAIRHYEEALRIRPDYAEAQNNLAWALATLAPQEGGNPVRAVALAEQTCKITGNRAATCLDTLAAAYAAAGRFNNAIVTAQKAIDLARSGKQPQLIDEIEARLRLYRSGQAYRQLRSPVPAPSADLTPQTTTR